jgi:uncharacterized damage-inducible protein DinB
MTLGELLSDELRRALRGEAWHGPSVQELIAPLSAEEAMQRPIPAAHNIWELVVHLTSWSNIVLRRINGGQVEPYEGEDWPEVHEFTDEHWTQAREALAESYERLSEVVLGMTNEELSSNAPSSTRSVAGMVSGVAQHTSYHGGQIAILRKTVTTQHRRAAL